MGRCRVGYGWTPWSPPAMIPHPHTLAAPVPLAERQNLVREPFSCADGVTWGFLCRVPGAGPPLDVVPGPQLTGQRVPAQGSHGTSRSWPHL